jgi:hypothetical protein
MIAAREAVEDAVVAAISELKTTIQSHYQPAMDGMVMRLSVNGVEKDLT